MNVDDRKERARAARRPRGGRPDRARRPRALAALAALAAAIAAPRSAGAADAVAPGARPPAGAAAELTRDGPFDADTVPRLARALAQAPFADPPSPLPRWLAGLDYDQYRDIRVRPDATIWARPGDPFRLQLLPPGYLFKTPVEIAIVKGGEAHHVAWRPEMFTAGELVPRPLPDQDVGFSGFRLLYPVNHPRKFDEVAVFQGASYFRSLGRDQVYGLSARGLAIGVGSPAGEEFPFFRAFWIEEPRPRSRAVTVWALLDSKSVTGAYRFEIRPGEATTMRVDAVLYPRVELADVGIAPETSMFMFSPSDRIGVDDFRPQVHDSDGLLVVDGRGEHLWRPLENPATLQQSAFLDRDPRGFGLLQRDRNPADYQDFESQAWHRPSLWVEPLGAWGDGQVVLTEIPSDSEIHDNVVLAWHPKTPLAAGSAFHVSYRLLWGGEPPAARGCARILSTAVGRADVKAPTPVRRFVVDYARVGRECAGGCAEPRAVVTASAGKVANVVVSENPLTHGDRVSFTLDPGAASLSELRLELAPRGGRCAEVWLYRWTKP